MPYTSFYQVYFSQIQQNLFSIMIDGKILRKHCTSILLSTKLNMNHNSTRQISLSSGSYRTTRRKRLVDFNILLSMQQKARIISMKKKANTAKYQLEEQYYHLTHGVHRSQKQINSKIS